MLISAKCQCGNENKKDFVEYEGGLGYEAIICKKCGAYADNDGIHDADKWSKRLIRTGRDSKVGE